MRQQCRCKSKTSIQRGWNSRIKVWRCCLKELFQWRTQVNRNKQIRLTFALPDVILRTDASKDQWGGTLTILKTGTTEMLNGHWSCNWKLNWSNQREIAAILQVVRRIKENYSNLNLQALRIESDNAASICHYKVSVAIALAKMADHVLEEAEEISIQIGAGYISGKQNQIADHLSRLAEAGDYSIKDEYIQEVVFQMRIKPTIDVFANRCNRKMRRFCSLKEDRLSVKQDGLTIPWASELAYLHPTLALIQKCLNKIMEKKARVVMFTPFWPAQPWWPDLKRMTIKSMILGESQDLLTLGGRLKRRKRHLLPGSLIISLLEGNQEKNSTNMFLKGWDQNCIPKTVKLLDCCAYGGYADKELENSHNIGQILESNGKN
ncbi:MAG: hypothetical protein EZS28_015236 [Streblomastix strix]|uniref:RNase H type-1 domain-containing protein n=1 Tax=Streblomastix strix TaxID=222440 RepID=A0A5J4W3T5_9EUKA|nr:MAG: hypothetical protein EZS28_015236 [Streblomastix strix]